MATYAENPADSGRCRHCGKPPYLQDPHHQRDHRCGQSCDGTPLAKAWQEEQPTGDSGLRQCRRIYPTKGTRHFRTG